MTRLIRDQPDLLTLESRLDELGPRYFRRTLLCHAEATLDRRINTDRIAGHWITAADPYFVTINGVRVPYSAFDNHDDVTTGRGHALGQRLAETLESLWESYLF